MPNIDRIAREGAIFTDAYGQQSCTAGRASFILGQEPFRTGLLTIGMPGDPHGIQDWMPTIADAHEDARLRHRAVRQEPSRRPRRAPADQARLRRILRQSLSPQCGRGAGRLLLPEGSELPEAVRPSRRHQGVRGRKDRRHGSSEHGAHADGGRGVSRRRQGLHRPPGQGRSSRSSSGSTRRECTSSRT